MRLDQHRGNNVALMIWDKEHDRILKMMDNLRNRYSEHQFWSDEDKNKFNALKARRDELRKLLKVKF